MHISETKLECIQYFMFIRNSNNLSYINRSNILENMDNKEIGR